MAGRSGGSSVGSARPRRAGADARATLTPPQLLPQQGPHRQDVPLGRRHWATPARRAARSWRRARAMLSAPLHEGHLLGVLVDGVHDARLLDAAARAAAGALHLGLPAARAVHLHHDAVGREVDGRVAHARGHQDGARRVAEARQQRVALPVVGVAVHVADEGAAPHLAQRLAQVQGREQGVAEDHESRVAKVGRLGHRAQRPHLGRVEGAQRVLGELRARSSPSRRRSAGATGTGTTWYSTRRRRWRCSTGPTRSASRCRRPSSRVSEPLSQTALARGDTRAEVVGGRQAPRRG